MLDNTRQYEMLVRPLGRTAADEYYHNGSIWIEGREGNSYTIELRNHSNSRALFILSVDGLDVLEGKPAGIDSQGYVLNPNDTINVPGWKLNHQNAAEFFFSRKRDSYVNSIGGTTTNTGVIGVMVFAEYQDSSITSSLTNLNNNDIRWRDWTPTTSVQWTVDMYHAAINSIGSNSAQTNIDIQNTSTQQYQNYVSQDVGTGFGSAIDWHTQTTQFRRNNYTQPDTIIAIYYNTAKNLEKMGIKLRRKRDVQYKADPFPAYTDSSLAQGCPIPKNWSR